MAELPERLRSGRWSTSAQRARDRLAPAPPLTLTRRGIHPRLETPLAPPHCGEAWQIRAQSRSIACEIGGAERGRLHHRRAIDRRGQNVGQELHGDVA